MKYLVIKGWLGFGDRLESTKMALAFAIKHDLIVYVDWSDSIWSHGTETFYTYFNLINIKQIESLSEIPEDATVFPQYWKGRLSEPISQELLTTQKDLYVDVANEAVTNKIDTDVIVFSCIGYRTLFMDSTFFSNIFRVKDERILEKVKYRLNNYNLEKSIGIHVRGTDRVRSQTQRELKIQWMAVSALNQGALNNKPMIGVSDDNISLKIWRNFFPQTIILSELSLQNTTTGGIHNADKSLIKNTKDELNVDMLVDFFTLSLCESIITTYKDSRFTSEARRLHPVIKRILNF